MNLEKTINKNMFDMSTSIRDKNPLETPDFIKGEQTDESSTQSTSMLSHPKQKLTAQFKRAITMIKQRSEPTRESSPPQFQTSISLIEKPNNSFDSNLLTSLTEESTHDTIPLTSREIPPSKPQSFIHNKKSSNKDIDSNNTPAATIITMDSTRQTNNQNLSTHLIKSNLQKIHTAVIQAMNQQSTTPQTSSSSSAALSPTSASATGELAVLETIL